MLRCPHTYNIDSIIIKCINGNTRFAPGDDAIVGVGLFDN